MARIDLTTLNASQRDVATRLDEPLFVAAGAGSGKTYTLTARLVHALSEGSAPGGGRFLDSIDQALVITFTRAAAAEIKDRVRQALRSAGETDPHLKEESLRVDGAWISTIHGMCSRILCRYGCELGIDARFEVVEGSVAEALLARALDEVLREVARDEAYSALLAEFRLWGDEGSVVGMLRRLRAEAAKCAHGYDDLVCPSSSETEAAMRRLGSCLDAILGLSLSAKQAEVATASAAAVSAYLALPPGARTAAAAAEALADLKVPDIRKKDLKPLVADCREALDEAYVIAHFERVQDFAPELVHLARRVDERYGELKAERSYLDNDDLVELALRAVTTCPAVYQDLGARFRLVMVDEFQDTDEKQLRLISLLSGKDACHLTTVGDAQQAIYRFRGGDVEVFRARGRSLPERSHVQMDVNYRSDHHVLALVERVCGDAQVLDDFLPLAGAAARRDRYLAREADGSACPRAFLELSCGGTSDVLAATQAAQVADRLRQLADAGQDVSTMAVLLGRTTNVGLFLDALRARGLPAVVTGGSSFTSTSEVQVIQALLHALANPHDTERGLFRLLSSEMFGLDADDFCLLATMEQASGAPCRRNLEACFVEGTLDLIARAAPSPRLASAFGVMRRAFERLGRWELADVCQAAVEESGWLARLERQGPDGLAVAANVLAALRYVRELAGSLGLGVSRAAEEFDQWLKLAKLTPKSLSGEERHAVQVMTIHGSKGLQFGVTAVAECWSPAKLKGRLSIGPAGGARVVCVAPSASVKKLSERRRSLEVPAEARACGSVAEWASFVDAANLAAEDAEKARLLYVALTRAEEALVVALPVAGKTWLRSPLAMRTISAFPELESMVEDDCGELPLDIEPAGGIFVERREDVGGEGALVRERREVAPGLARVVSLRREGTQDPWQAYSRGTLAGFDGELPASVTLIPVAGCQDPAAPEATRPSAPFELFALEGRGLSTYGWRVREGVYSYTSIRAAERAAERAAAGEAVELPTEDMMEAEAEGRAHFADTDKATALGSAFHALAETMVATDADHDPARAEALARAWRLSERQQRRLKAAIARWETSELRQETRTWRYRRAEVPFFLETPGSPFGTHIEGAIDLLCTDTLAPEGRALVVDYKTGDIGLSQDEAAERHEEQARLYARVLRDLGFTEVTCAFISVETGVVCRWEL